MNTSKLNYLLQSNIDFQKAYIDHAKMFYRTDKRYYHTIEHIIDMYFCFLEHYSKIIEWIPEFKVEKRRFNTFMLAIAFHDAYYVPAFSKNEEMSFEILHSILSEIITDNNYPYDDYYAKILILSTSDNTASKEVSYAKVERRYTLDNAIFHDLDYNRFRSIRKLILDEKKIFTEYFDICQPTDKIFAINTFLTNRIKFYESMEYIDIFRSYPFAKYNKKAKQNIRARIAVLKEFSPSEESFNHFYLNK